MLAGTWDLGRAIASVCSHTFLQLVYSVARRVAHMQVTVRKRQTGTQAQTELRGWDCVVLLRSGPDIRSKIAMELLEKDGFRFCSFLRPSIRLCFRQLILNRILSALYRISYSEGCDCSFFPIPSSRGRPCSSLTHHLALGATELLQLRKQHSLSGPVGLHPHV